MSLNEWGEAITYSRFTGLFLGLLFGFAIGRVSARWRGAA